MPEIAESIVWCCFSILFHIIWIINVFFIFFYFCERTISSNQFRLNNICTYFELFSWKYNKCRYNWPSGILSYDGDNIYIFYTVVQWCKWWMASGRKNEISHHGKIKWLCPGQSIDALMFCISFFRLLLLSVFRYSCLLFSFISFLIICNKGCAIYE